MIQVAIVDDHTVLRSGLKLLLAEQEDIEVVWEAASGEEALEKCLAQKPEILILDLNMPGAGGLAAIERLTAQFPQVKILVLTMHHEEAYLRKALAAGARGYVLKKAADMELFTAIKAVARGEVFLDPSMTKYLLANLQGREPEKIPGDRLAKVHLTEREKEVLRLVALGYTNKEIAGQLYISIKTVEVYKAKLKEKFQASGRSALVKVAMEYGLLD